MSERLSYSKVELYKQCPKKYEFKYVHKLENDTTASPLLFGKSLDKALNYVLKQFKAGKVIKPNYAKQVFTKEMKTWTAQNELVFFKSEIPDEDYIKEDPQGNQLRAWLYLIKVGQMMIDTYITEVLPNFSKVIEIQKKKKIINDQGDVFTLVLDCIVELKDGRQVLLDNKSASRPYAPTAVTESNQLAIYNEAFPVPFAGYVVMHKRLTDNKVTWQLLVDQISEEKKEITYQEIDEVLAAIKDKQFPQEKSSCYAYGKRCQYYNACHKNDYRGLKKQP